MENLTLFTDNQIGNKDELDWPIPMSNIPDTGPPLTFNGDEMALWSWFVTNGITKVLSGLSQMVGHEIEITSLDLTRLPAKDATALLGGPEAVAIGIYLTIHGDTTGHLILMHESKITFQLIDLQLGLPPGSTQKLEETGCSILKEIGNLTGSFFLNALTDTTDLVLMPAPPAVTVDMVGTIMNTPMAMVTENQDYGLIAKTTFGSDSRQINGTFLVLPTTDFMKILLK